MEKRQPKQQHDWTQTLFWALAILVFLNIIFTMQFASLTRNQLAMAEERARPAKLSIIALTDNACTACMNASRITAAVRAQHVDITGEQSLEYSSDEAKALITQYSIQSIPAVILKGEIDKTSIPGFKKEQDALVYAATTPPYADAKTGVVQGKVSVILLDDATCKECSDLMQLVQQLKAAGIYISDQQDLDVSSKKAKDLIQSYRIEKIPTILLSPDAKVYPLIVRAWPQLGSVESDGWYVQRQVAAPYLDIKQNKIKGFVDVTYITDKGCTQCYDIKTVKQILQANHVAVQNENIVDMNDAAGLKLVKQYNITTVPTFIVQGDFDAYTGLAQAWPQVGTKESNNVWVFRKPGALNVAYKDLSTGTVEEPSQGDGQ